MTKRILGVQDFRMSPLNVSELKAMASGTPVQAALTVQLQSRQRKYTKAKKPYDELSLADSTGGLILKVWSDSPVAERVTVLEAGAVVRLCGEWTQNAFGIDGRLAAVEDVPSDQAEAFFLGDPALQQLQADDYAEIERLCGTIQDPRLAGLCRHFLATQGERFRRTAAARKNHHARRGGLVEHVARMMRSAAALAPVYPNLNRDLLITGVLFHDCGKLWENSYPERGFAQKHSMYGEMLGHIPLGIELVNHLWSEVSADPVHSGWAQLVPPSDHVRLHLLHLIGSHHGEYQFGSPVLPKTPEAFALHFIDNLDAKLEMVSDAYASSTEIAPGIFERMFPLAAGLVQPLPCWDAAAVAADGATSEAEGVDGDRSTGEVVAEGDSA